MVWCGFGFRLIVREKKTSPLSKARRRRRFLCPTGSKIKHLQSFCHDAEHIATARARSRCGRCRQFRSMRRALHLFAEIDFCNAKIGVCSTKLDVYSRKVDACSTEVDTCNTKFDVCMTKIGVCSTKADACSTKTDACSKEVEPCSAKVDVCSTKVDARA